MTIPPNPRTTAAARQLGRALLSASDHSRTWTPTHEQALHHLLRSSQQNPALTPSLLSSTIDPHLLSHHHLAHGLFNWASQQPTFSHTPQTYHSLLKSLSLSRQSHSIQAILKQAGAHRIHLLLSSYHMAISSLLLCGRTLEASRLISQVPISSSDVSVLKTYNSLLAALADDGYWGHAKQLFDEMVNRNVGFNDVGFGVFIGGFCRTVDLDKSLSLVDEIKRRGCEINGSIVALLVVDGLCQAGRAEEAWHALEELRIRACKPDFMAYRIVAEAFKTMGRLEETARVLKQKRKLGVAPRMTDYKEFIFALLSERRIRVAKELGKAIIDGDFPIENDVLEALISSISTIDPDSATSFCMYMVRTERFPSFATLSNLSRNLCKNGKTDEMWGIFKVLMSKDYFRDLEEYNVIVSFLCKVGSVREAYEVLKEMKKKGFNPDVYSYNSLMEACCREDLLRPAKRLWDEMFANACYGNLQTYNILIQKFSEIDDAEEAQRLFHHMLEKGVVPDSVTHTSLVKVLCRENRIDDAREIFNKSVEQDTVLAGSVLSTLITCLCKEGNFLAASRLLHGLSSNIEISNAHIILLKSLSDAGQFERAIEHVEWVRDNSPTQLQTTLNKLMASLSTAPNLEPILQLLRAISKRSLLSNFGPWAELHDGLLAVC